MSLSIGIVGLPNVGKSTLFNALTKKSVDAANYPFCTIDPSVGVVPVPDSRLQALAELSHSAEIIPAVVEFVDIAGLVEGASEGQGLGNQFLSHIREVDAIAQMVRIFDDEDIVHVAGHVNPLRDVQIINLELILADLQVTNKRLGSLEKEIRSGSKEALYEKSGLEKVKQKLENETFASQASLTDDEAKYVKRLNLLTMKPFMYILNKKSGARNLDEIRDDRFMEVEAYLRELGAQVVYVDAVSEGEINDMTHDERKAFRSELGLSGGVDDLIVKGYELLDLITFFTTGEEETRGWTVKRDSTAPQAGAAIHTDFKDKFIRADVVFWKDLVDAGSRAVAREKGLLRTEGKEYIVKDGDVIEFRV